MRVLLDTCVVSELARPRRSPRVVACVTAIPPGSVYLSAVTVGELARGVALLPSGKKRDRYASFLLDLEEAYQPRILPIDARTARRWGEIDAARKRIGRPISVPDGQIAATAAVHELRVVTRNVREFAETGVLVVDPWSAEES